MLAIRSTPRVSAIVAAAAGACLMLGGCGGGSTPAAAGNTSSATATAGGGSTGSGSSGSSTVAGFSAPKLTGHFCTDFTNIGRNLPKVPAADRNSLAALQAHGGQFIKAAAAYFNGLAGEAPPQASAELKIIASAYSSLAGGAVSASSVTQFEKQMQSLTTSGKTGQAFIGLVTYITTHCG
jgi:hypothetical protein